MGGKSSKTKRKKSPRPQETSDAKQEAPSPKKSEPEHSSSGSPRKDEEPELPEEWHDRVLFSKDANDKPISKEDFELLKVIGKGSFGKVCLPCGVVPRC